MRIALFITLLSALAANLASAQSTAFTYQGRLTNAEQPASGLHDFRFRLYDAASGGNQLGTTLCANNVAVSNGLFTTTLDFGQQFATPAPRYLEIFVRADIGQPCTDDFGYVLLTPRQLFTPTPMASHANAAFALDARDGSPANAVIVDEVGRVGIGTASPESKLHIRDLSPVLLLQDSNVTSQQIGRLSFMNDVHSETAFLGFFSPGSPDLYLSNNRNFGNIRLNPGPNGGRVFIGSNFATVGEENLRIIRGEVRKDTIIRAGSGFTVQHADNATYDISFTTPFAAQPVVTATAYRGDSPGSTAEIIVMIEFITPAKVRLVVRNAASGTWIDHHFNFIAIGPR
jgi:hypothetical protein